jgi:hypothetical protein
MKKNRSVSMVLNPAFHQILSQKIGTGSLSELSIPLGIKRQNSATQKLYFASLDILQDSPKFQLLFLTVQ